MRTDHRRRIAAAAAAVPLVLLFTGCATPTDHREITATVINGAAGFDPAAITVEKEDTVVITVSNTTDKTHGFSIQGMGVRKTVDPNQTLRVKFRAGRGGAFKIYCQLHPAHGTATLLVE